MVLSFVLFISYYVSAEEQAPIVGSDEIQRLSERVDAIEKSRGEVAKNDASDGKSGYKGGFYIKSADDNFSLKINLAVQFRYTYLPFDDMVNANSEEWSNFMMRRARVWFQGSAPNKDWAYYLHVQLEPQGAVNLNDAYITWKKCPYANYQIGRSKIPYGLEIWNSGTQLNAVERTIFSGETDVDGKTDTRKWPGGNANFPVSDEDSVTKFPIGGLNLYRSQGIKLLGEVKSGYLQYWVAIFNGRNTKGGVNVDAEPLLAARVSLNPFGKCNLSQQGDLDGTPSPKLCLLASAMRYTDRLAAIRSSTTGNSQTVSAYNINSSGYNIAETFKFKGFSLDAEYGTESFEQDRTGGYDWERLGYRVSAGYFILPKKLEIVARYAYVERLKDNTMEDSLASGLGLVSVDGGTDNAIEDNLKETTCGLNYYIDGHNLKLSADYSYLKRALSPVNPSDSIDDRHDNRMRAMIQLAY